MYINNPLKMNKQFFLYSLQDFTQGFKNHVKCCKCEFTKNIVIFFEYQL